MTDLPAYGDNHPCPKCGGLDVSTSYEEANAYRVPWDCKFREEREHLHRFCRRCRFEWVEACLATTLVTA